jgi:hypothetical protein
MGFPFVLISVAFFLEIGLLIGYQPRIPVYRKCGPIQ